MNSIQHFLNIYSHIALKMRESFIKSLTKKILLMYYRVGRVFANGPGDLGSNPGHVIPRTLKMVLDTSLLNTQQYIRYVSGVK